jgi:hypothetical protein
MWPETKENEGLGGIGRHAVSCNFLSRRVREHQRRQNRFDCPDDLQSRNGLAIGIRFSYDSSTRERGVIPCGFFEN